VDVGLAPIARRLGLRRLARRLREEWIGWDEIYLASARGHVLAVCVVSLLALTVLPA